MNCICRMQGLLSLRAREEPVLVRMVIVSKDVDDVEEKEGRK